METIKYLIFTNNTFTSDCIDIEANKDKVIMLHPYINNILEDCKDLSETDTLTILIPDIIDLNDNIIKYTLLLEPLQNPINFRDLYFSFKLMDFLTSDKIIYDLIKESKVLLDKTQLTRTQEVYRLACIYKLYHYIHDDILNLYNTNEKTNMANFVLQKRNNFENDFLAYITYRFNKFSNLYLEAQHQETAKQRLTSIFGNLINKLDFNGYIIAGGSINIALDESIPLNTFTDLDIYILASQHQDYHHSNVTKNIINMLIELYGRENIYIHNGKSIKYIYINDIKFSIQIIATQYTIPYEVVNNFDTSNVRCWYDGSKFYQSLDCLASIKSKIAFASKLPLRASRQYKIQKRGYIVKPIHLFNTDKYEDQLTTLNYDNYNRDEVCKYVHVESNRITLFPSRNNTIMANQLGIALMLDKIYKDIELLSFIIVKDIKIEPIFNIIQVYTNSVPKYNINSNGEQYFGYDKILNFSKYFKININNFMTRQGYNDYYKNNTEILSYHTNNEYKEFKINMGAAVLSNIIKTKEKNSNYHYILYIQNIKNEIFNTLKVIFRIIRDKYPEFTQNYNENILRKKFPYTPMLQSNNMNDYIGDYLICSPSVDTITKKHKIGDIINIKLRFLVLGANKTMTGLSLILDTV